MSELRSQGVGAPEVRAQAEPVPEPPPAPAPVPEPVAPEPAPPPVETPPPVEPPPAAAEPVPSTLRPSLLSEAEAPAQPQAPVFEAYNLPEGVTLGEREVGEFNAILGNAELSPQQRGQELVNLYVTEMQRVAQTQHEVFNRTREEWRNQFFNDPELGGNRQDTTLRQAAQIRDRFAGTEQQRAELIAAFDHTGIGDHPAFIRFLANIAHELTAPRLVAAQNAPQAPTDGPGRRYPTMVRS